MGQPSLRRQVTDSPKKDQAEPILQDLEKYAALDGLANLPGGKILVETITEDILNAIESITGSYKKATHAELQGYAASLEAKLGVLRALKNAGKNKTLAREALAEVLKD